MVRDFFRHFALELQGEENLQVGLHLQGGGFTHHKNRFYYT